MEMLNDSFLFARPMWFLAIIPIIMATFFISKQARSAQAWNKHISPELLNQLTDQQTGRSNKHWLTGLATITALLIVFALAGPSFKSNDVKAVQTDDTLVIIMDLSLSMLAEDIKPSRLQRVKFKLQDVLKQRKTGHTALIVYSGDAHVVVPLTEDTETIQHLAKSLNPWMIPSKGSRLYRAVEEANKLLSAYPSSNSRVLVFTDEISKQQLDKTLAISKHPTYVVGVGTQTGAPIPLPDKKLLKDNRQNIIVAKFSDENPKQLAHNTKASYHFLSVNNDDISDALNFEPNQQQQAQALEALSALKDYGYLLLIPMLFLFLLTFRKGWLFMFALFIIQPESSYANTVHSETTDSTWASFWQNQQQQAQTAYDQGDYETAANLFETPLEKGNAYAQAKQWENAETQYKQLNNANGLYNLANVQAQQGKLDEALESYDSAIKEATKENNQNALNRAQKDKQLIEQLKQQQEQQEQQEQQNKDQQGQNGDQQNNSDQNQQSQDSQQQNSENQSQSDKSQSSSDREQSSSGSSSEQNSAELDEQQAQDAADSAQKNQQEPDKQDSDQQEPSQQNASQQNTRSALSEEEQSRDENATQGSAEASSNQESQQDADQGIHDYQTTQSTEPLDPEDIEEQKYQQILRKIQSDPSVLLQNKFKIQHYQRNQPEHEAQVW
jgi:Ca-activated chloride channel family protein